jgi:molybdenum cofactor biosynthesis enzyme MoaA
MKLEHIGFYTLSEDRVENLSSTSPMQRCEMILTDRCNFKCPYCRGIRDDCQGSIPFEKAIEYLGYWIQDGLKNVRFSGGEPLMYKRLAELVEYCVEGGVERIAISSNGSFPFKHYVKLIDAGVNDFSISLDACCAADCGQMSGGCGSISQITSNIRELSKLTYVTVGVVLTDTNAPKLGDIVQFAHDLGVADIRIIPAAQQGSMIQGVEAIPPEILDAHPILSYRVRNIRGGRPVRSIDEYDSARCYLPIDDSVICGEYHFPCVIYMREQGDPIGKVGPDMRAERMKWADTHHTHTDPICQKNCLDVCIDHNNRCAAECGVGHNVL